MLRIGILTHNGLHHTQRCLASLQAHTHVPWQAWVVDNASSDETPAWLAALDDPRITVELRPDNLGVSGGRNHLFRQLVPAMGDDDLLVFLDNDMEVGAGWEQPFLDTFAAEPRLGVAGHWAFSMLVHDTWRDILSEHTNASAPADTVQGCCFWVRGAAARAVGEFDESLGRFWHEDDDYCIRALHAGWDVQRVRSPTLVHHEHGSGVALRPERVAGSLANQARLAAKWRALGAIDAHGVPRRPMPEPMQPLRDALGRTLQRRGPLVRTELHSAVHDAARLLHGTTTDDEAALCATPAVRALLTDAASAAVQAGDVTTRERALAALARIDAIRRTRRDDHGLPCPAPAAAPAFSAVCQPAAWDDSRWAQQACALLRDGRGTDYYSRSEIGWRDGQLAYALGTAGVVRAPAHVLVVGHYTEALIVALSHVAARITVLDTDPVAPERFAEAAGRPLGPAVVETGPWLGASRAPAGADIFDVVVCPNLSRYAPAPDTPALLGALAERLRPGGILAVAASVRASGPPTPRWLEARTFGDDTLLAAIGLRRIGRFEAAVPDETLLAAVPEHAPAPWRPRLARRLGAHIVTVATLVARRS
jgi:GT2 family glycosyltransferase/SAM-dependent methyltransferase